MQSATITIILTVLSVAAAAQESPSDAGKASSSNPPQLGTVCVLPNSPEPPTRISPGGEYNPATLKVRIDKREPIPWPHKRVFKIDNLSLVDRHLIVLTSDGKPIQSFWFRFSDHKDVKLCVAFDGYQGVQFGDKYEAPWCRCK